MRIRPLLETVCPLYLAHSRLFCESAQSDFAPDVRAEFFRALTFRPTATWGARASMIFVDVGLAEVDLVREPFERERHGLALSIGEGGAIEVIDMLK